MDARNKDLMSKLGAGSGKGRNGAGAGKGAIAGNGANGGGTTNYSFGGGAGKDGLGLDALGGGANGAGTNNSVSFGDGTDGRDLASSDGSVSKDLADTMGQNGMTDKSLFQLVSDNYRRKETMMRGQDAVSAALDGHGLGI
jgi:hypothetical protein